MPSVPPCLAATNCPTYFRYLVGSGFLAIMSLSIYLVGMKVSGIPLRTGFVLGLLGLIALGSPAVILRAVQRQAFILLLIVYAALCAVVASVLAGNDPVAILGQVMEIHIQAICGVILGYAVIQVCGTRWFGIIFALPITISVLFAVFQFLGVQAAWAVYDTLASLQPQSTAELWYYDVHARPLGLSYSPVLLATQTCLLFAALFGVFAAAQGARQVLSRLHPWIFSLAIGVIATAIVAGNRSPLLGVVIFLAAFICRARPALGVLLLLSLPAFVILADAILEMMNASGLRVLNTENSSGEGRAALRAYGFLLFLDQPFGYGLSFNSLDHWWKYWEAIQRYDNANAITQHALHNSYLMTLNKHGVLITFLIPLIVRRLFTNQIAFFAFIPYLIHVFYHNDGPLQGDFLFWYILPLFSQASSANKASQST